MPAKEAERQIVGKRIAVPSCRAGMEEVMATRPRGAGRGIAGLFAVLGHFEPVRGAVAAAIRLVARRHRARAQLRAGDGLRRAGGGASDRSPWRPARAVRRTPADGAWLCAPFSD